MLAKNLNERLKPEKIVILTEAHPERPLLEKNHNIHIYRALLQRDTKTKKNLFYYVMSYFINYFLIMFLSIIFIVRYKIIFIHATRYITRSFFLFMRALKLFSPVKLVFDLRATSNYHDELKKISGCDLIIANSLAVYNEAKKELKCSDDLVLIKNPVDFPTRGQVDELCAKSDLKIGGEYILFVGQILDRKSPIELIDAFEALVNLEKYYDLKLVFVGRNMLGDVFIKRMQKNQKIIFLGPLPKPDVFVLMLNSAVVALPSKIEGIPRAALEAISLGCKVLLPPCVPEFEDCAPFFPKSSIAEDIYNTLKEVCSTDEKIKYDLNDHDIYRSFNELEKAYRALV